jgi:aspartyl protease family protein
VRSFAWIAVLVLAAALLAAGRLPGPPPGEERGRPGEAKAAGDGWNRITIPADSRGHYLVEAEVNGTPVTFLVDSGASSIVLSPEDARRVGLAPERLRFTERYRTANGTVRAAPVELREIRIGQLAQRFVPASVNEAPIGVSLLGMTFLSRLESWGVEGGRLALYW